MFRVLNQLFLFHEAYCHGAEHEKYSGNEEHAHLSATDHLENQTSACCCGDLWKADGTVEQTEVCSDVFA